MSLRDRPDPLTHEQRRARRPAGGDVPLRRAREGRRIAGIAAGIATFVGADPRTVRALFVLTIPLSLGLSVAGYLLLWLLLPADD
jgi:phage shock protein PspC (stress-responsive transcriptional regulator)